MTSRIVVVGKGDNTMAYSDNSGVTWTGLGKIFTNRCIGIAYSETQDHWLAVGQGGSDWAYHSEDGINWDVITTNRLTRGYGVATNGNRWVVVGRGANNKNRTIVYSDNGRTGWKNIGNSRTDIFTGNNGEGLGVACNGNNWVAVGGGAAGHRIAYSTDNAETWTHSLMDDGSNTDTLFTNRGNTVSTNGSRWIAGGYGTSNGDFMLLGYSDNNGQTWSKVTDPVIDTFTEIFGSHWDGNKFWIGGTASSVKLAYSTNGLNWTAFGDVGGYYVKARAFLSYDNVIIIGGDTLTGAYSSSISIDNGNSFSPGISADDLEELLLVQIFGFARKYTPPPPPPVPYFAKGVNMPKKDSVADGGNSFVLGRRAFFNNTYKSHKSSNSGKNIDYSSVKEIQSSNVFGKPINNNGSGLRTQRLRLTSIGICSIKVNKENEQITFAKPDANYVNRALSRVRGSGGGGPKR